MGSKVIFACRWILRDPSLRDRGVGSRGDAVSAGQSVADRSPEAVARDEDYWREIQLDFELDRTIINLNNGYTSPAPRVVLESEQRFLEMFNMAPILYQLPFEERIQTIRVRMANEFGCAPEELALTRNASESLQIVQNGFDLKAGDEVVTTDQDYPRMLTTWDQNGGGATVSRWFGFNSQSRQQPMISFPLRTARSRRERSSCISHSHH